MSEKSTGLSAFLQPEAKPAETPRPAKAAKEKVAQTVRLSPANNERIGHFLVSNRDEFPSFQALALAGINKIFEERGMKPLKQ